MDESTLVVNAFQSATRDVGILVWHSDTVEEAEGGLKRRSFEVSMTKYETEGVMTGTRTVQSSNRKHTVRVITEIRFEEGRAATYRIEIGPIIPK